MFFSKKYPKIYQGLLASAWSLVLSDFQGAFLHPAGIACSKGRFAMPFLPVVPPLLIPILYIFGPFPQQKTFPPPP
jgi:hypothetical protein